MTREDAGEGQDTAAAERSASVPRETPEPVVDTRPHYAVEVLDSGGKLVRSWVCRLEEPPDGYLLQIRRL